MVLPQWSPSTKDGTTRRGCRGSPTCPGAAMEPVHEGRDDAHGRRIARRRETAAMEPVHEGRDDIIETGTAEFGFKPQWSPSTKDGTTDTPTDPGVGLDVAAMEPVHEGRDDTRALIPSPPVSRPQWSPSTKDGTTPVPGEHP